MFNVLCDKALENGGALKTHVTCLLDEFLPRFFVKYQIGDIVVAYSRIG